MTSSWDISCIQCRNPQCSALTIVRKNYLPSDKFSTDKSIIWYRKYPIGTAIFLLMNYPKQEKIWQLKCLSMTTFVAPKLTHCFLLSFGWIPNSWLHIRVQLITEIQTQLATKCVIVSYTLRTKTLFWKKNKKKRTCQNILLIAFKAINFVSGTLVRKVNEPSYISDSIVQSIKTLPTNFASVRSSLSRQKRQIVATDKIYQKYHHLVYQ